MNFLGGFCGVVLIVLAVLAIVVVKGGKRWPPCPRCGKKLAYQAGVTRYSSSTPEPVAVAYLECAGCRGRWVLTGETDFQPASAEEWVAVVVNKPD